MNAVLISAERNQTRDALSEAWYVFTEHLGLTLRRRHCSIPGLAIIDIVNTDVLEVMKKIRTFVFENQPSFMACLTFTPLMRIFSFSKKPPDGLPEGVNYSYHQILSAMEPLIASIRQNESWRVTVRKRYSTLHSQDIITYLVDNLPLEGIVNLTEPQKVIRVEILGKICGVAVHEPNDVISIPKLMKEKIKTS